MNDNHHLIANPSVLAAAITAAVSLIIALVSCFWALHSAKVTLQLENDRLIGFHKLEIYENAIAEINYLVPLYHQLWSDAYEKRSASEVRAALPALRQTINLILEYQKSHNAIGKAQVYSEALREYVPFISNHVCIEYIRQIDVFEKQGKSSRLNLDHDGNEHFTEMNLLDELDRYQQCAEQLKKEIENLHFFER